MMMMNDSNMDVNNASVDIVNVTETLIRRHAYYMPLTIFSLVLCLFGLLGNGTIFWILCFKIKRNPFTVYILNLAVADFMFLLGLEIWMMYTFCVLNGVKKVDVVQNYIAIFTGLFYNFGFNASVYLLMDIALERCIAVVYPFWNQCYRPPNLSAYVSIVSWLLSFLVTGLENFICTGEQYQAPGSQPCTNVYFFTSALYLIVVLIMVFSSITLLIKIKTHSKHCRPPKVYIVIIISITIFLTSVVPARILGLLIYFNILTSDPFLVAFFFITSLCSAFNCSADPYIYMAVSRWGKHRSEPGSIKKLLEKLFKDAAETEDTNNRTYRDSSENTDNVSPYDISQSMS